ncbi:MAG: hypothetical protein ACPGXY_00615 [Alphaproteobacteria bacterium]
MGNLFALKVQLVCIETDDSSFYDLYYPGHSWADTEGLWRPQGLGLPGPETGASAFRTPKMVRAISRLNDQERNHETRWTLFDNLYFMPDKNPRAMPIVASTLGKDGKVSPSKIDYKSAIDIIGLWHAQVLPGYRNN